MALPKKKKAQSGYCAPCCSFVCISIGILLICIGTLIPKAINTKVQQAIYDNGIVKPTTLNYTHVQKSSKGGGAEVFLIYHFFNITNPAGVMNGEAPKMVKLGPYVFQKWATEGQVQYFDGGTKKASRKHGEIEFIPGRSNGKLTDVVWMDNIFSNWFWHHCNGALKPDSTIKNEIGFAVFAWCKRIALHGIFHDATVEQWMWGTKMSGGIPYRYNNGHQKCPPHIPTCNQAWLQNQYNPHAGARGGQFSKNWNAKKIKEGVSVTGVGNEGCKRPLDNQGCFTQEMCTDPWDPEDEGHNTICTKGQAVTFTPLNIGTTNGCVFNFNKGSPPPMTGPNYNNLDAAQLKKCFTKAYKWYDETPYDKTDDLAFETTVEQDGGKPCKWDGTTNGKAGCPWFEKVRGHGTVTQGLFYPPRQRQNDFEVFDNGFYNRPVTMKFKSSDDVNKAFEIHAADTHKYVLSDAHYAPDGKNVKYGMDSRGSFWQYPGAGSFPMRTQVNHIPLVWTLPHWHRGGDVSNKWNTAMGLRQSREKDDMVFYYEPITGLPFDMNLDIQWNLVWHEKQGGCLIQDENGTTTHDFSKLDLSHKGLGIVDLTKMGKWMKDVTPKSCAGTGGCHSMHPSWHMKVALELTPHTAAKLRNLIHALKGLAGLQGKLNQLMIFGVACIIATFLALIWKYYGPEDDKSSALQAAA